MDLREVMLSIKDKKAFPLYIFSGEEIAIMDIYIKQIANIIGTTPKRVDSLSSIFNTLQNRGIMNIRNCYVIRDDKDLLQQEQLWPQLENGLIQGENIIILIYTNLDKRTKFHKQYNHKFTQFDKLAPEILARYIENDIGLSGKDAIEFANLCDCNYNRIILESDKLKHLASANNIDIRAAYNLALSKDLIYISPQDVIFQFVDAVCKRQIRHCYYLYNQLKSINESPLGMITLLYNNLRSMLLVQSSGNVKDIENRTGLSGWEIKRAKEKGTQYTTGELVRALRLIRETERGIKTGQIEQDISIEYILAEVL